MDNYLIASQIWLHQDVPSTKKTGQMQNEERKLAKKAYMHMYNKAVTEINRNSQALLECFEDSKLGSKFKGRFQEMETIFLTGEFTTSSLKAVKRRIWALR